MNPIRTIATLLAAALLAAGPAAAQERVTVRGSVLDVDSQPVPGATVMVKDNAKLGGTVTDAKGNFTITIPAGSVLQVSCIGYQSAEQRIGKAMTWLVTLEEDAEMLDDVVVVGYGTQKKESIVGSISQVSSEALVNSGTTNITNALAGKLAGVLTFQNSGTPGNNDAEIFVRGISSWNGSAPLVMVDGIERSFSQLNPNEVKTISVLKDASATAVFGAKGANGVILVTTKSGLKGKPKMDLNVQYGINTPQELPVFVPSGTIGELMNVAYMNDQSFGSVLSPEVLAAYRDGTDPVRYPNNNWYQLLLKDFSQTFNADYSLSGGSEKVRYYVSVGYTNDGSIVKRINDWENTSFQYHKINYRTNLDFDLTKTTTLSLKVGGTTEIVQRPGDPDSSTTVSTLFTQMYMASPMMFPAYYPAETLLRIPDTDYPGISEDRLAQIGTAYTENPYTTLARGNFLQTTTNRLNTDLQLNQKLDFITKGLSLKGLVSLTSVFSRYSERGTQTRPVYRIDWEVFDRHDGENPWSSTEKGNDVYVQPPYSVAQDNTPRSISLVFYWEAALNYARKFNKKHNVTALALMNQREKLSGASFPHRNQAFVSRITYDYKGKYLFEANMGYTGSEQFSSKNRYGFFPSAAVGYVVSKEKFWKQAMPWWSTMKLRYSDGLVGSDSASANWLYYSSFSKSNGLIIEDKAANETARWETARKRDIGVEMGWFKDRLTLNVDLFDELRTDMLVTPTESPLIGITSKDVNSGSMKKHGIDIELKYRATTARGFYYEAGAMLGLNENRILNYEEPVGTPVYQKWAGTPYKAARTGMNQIDDGYFTSVDEIHGYPNSLGSITQLYNGIYKMLDYSADGIINSRDQHAIAGIAYPPAVGSVNFALGYKGFSFNMLFYGTHGKYIEYNRSFWKEFIKQDWTIHAAQLDYWTPANPNAAHPALSFDDKVYSMLGGSANTNGYTTMIEGQSWRKSDYVTLKELYLAYRFDGKKLQDRLGVRGLSITLTGNNLFTWTGLLEGNPQRTELVKSYYPIMRTVKLGVKLDF